ARHRVHLFLSQAEDGIRDRNVTGVQTCALPILPDRSWLRSALSPGIFTRSRNEQESKAGCPVSGESLLFWDQYWEADWLNSSIEIGRASCRECVQRSVGGEGATAEGMRDGG